MQPCRLQAFFLDRSGVAAVEFGLIAPLFVLALGVAVDCALVYRTKLRLISAASAASVYVAKQAGSITESKVSTIIENASEAAAFVAQMPSLKTTVLFNNAPTSINFSNYYCVSGSSPETWSWSSTGSTRGSCGTTKASKYVSIVVEATSSTFFTPPTVAARLTKVRDYVIVDVE